MFDVPIWWGATPLQVVLIVSGTVLAIGLVAWAVASQILELAQSQPPRASDAPPAPAALIHRTYPVWRPATVLQTDTSPLSESPPDARPGTRMRKAGAAG